MDMSEQQRTLWEVFQEEAETSLPYDGTSGWSGSSTSRERAVRADRDGTTTERQQQVISLLISQGSFGLTWKELGDLTGWHHGTASGVLSVLHKDERISRLSESRDRCKVYVHPTFVHGRATEPHGRKPKPCPACGYAGEDL